jgi:hypothetical protein
MDTNLDNSITRVFTGRDKKAERIGCISDHRQGLIGKVTRAFQ